MGCSFQSHRISWRSTAISFAFCLVLAACGSTGGQDSTGGENFLPPRGATSVLPTINPVLTATAAQQTTSEVSRPTPTPLCTDNLSFLADMTIPDGTVVAPGDALDKRWQVENSGTCNWDESYRLKLIAGPELGVPAEQALYPARSGTQTVIEIQFTAPNDPGTYRSAWQAYNPQGAAFGDPFFIEVLVQAP